MPRYLIILFGVCMVVVSVALPVSATTTQLSDSVAIKLNKYSLNNSLLGSPTVTPTKEPLPTNTPTPPSTITPDTPPIITPTGPPPPLGTRFVYTSLIFNRYAALNCQSIENEAQYPNNSSVDAEASPPLCNGQSFRGKHNSGEDRDDVFRLLITENQFTTISLDVPSINLTLELYDNNGVLLERSFNPGLQDEIITTVLSSGTYFVRVYRTDNNISSQDYILTTTFSSSCEILDHEPNNLYLEADNNLPLCESSMVDGAVSRTIDVNDIYRIEVEQDSVLYIILVDLSIDADYDLYLDAGPGNNLAFSTNAGSANETITFAVTPGRYYIRVVAQQDGNPNGYQLRWTRP